MKSTGLVVAAAAGVGLYFYGRSAGWFSGAATAAPPAGTGTPVGSGVTVEPTPAPATTPTTLSLMAAAAARDPGTWKNTMSMDQWCFLYATSGVRGKPCPIPPGGIDGNVTLSEWYMQMQKVGLTGLSGSGYRRG